MGHTVEMAKSSETPLHVEPFKGEAPSIALEPTYSTRRLGGREITVVTPPVEIVPSAEKETRTNVKGVVFLVPVLNDGAGLEKFILSVKNQERTDIHGLARVIIVGDNGSDGVTQYHLIDKVHEFENRRDALTKDIQAHGMREEQVVLEDLKERRKRVVRDLRNGKPIEEILKTLCSNTSGQTKSSEEVYSKAMQLYDADTKYLQFLLDILNPKSTADREFLDSLSEKTQQEALATLEVYAKIGLGFYDDEDTNLVVKLGTTSRKGFLGSARESLLLDGLNYLNEHHPDSKEHPSDYIFVHGDADMVELPNFIQSLSEEFNDNKHYHALIGPIIGYSEKTGPWKGWFSRSVLRPVYLPLFFRQPLMVLHKRLKDFMPKPRTLSQGPNTIHDRYAVEAVRERYGHVYPVPGKTAEDAGATLLITSMFPFIRSKKVITPFSFRQAEIQIKPWKWVPKILQPLDNARVNIFGKIFNGRTNWLKGLHDTLWKIVGRNVGEHAAHRLSIEATNGNNHNIERGFTTYRGVDAYTTREVERSWGIQLEPYQWVARHRGKVGAIIASVLPGKKRIVQYYNPVRQRTQYAIIKELPEDKRTELPQGSFVAGFQGFFSRIRYAFATEEYMKPQLIRYQEGTRRRAVMIQDGFEDEQTIERVRERRARSQEETTQPTPLAA